MFSQRVLFEQLNVVKVSVRVSLPTRVLSLRFRSSGFRI